MFIYPGNGTNEIPGYAKRTKKKNIYIYNPVFLISFAEKDNKYLIGNNCIIISIICSHHNTNNI